MYLRDCWIENVGPIAHLELHPTFTSHGHPNPLLLVGQNGSGKTILLAHIIDALVELGKTAYQDVVSGQAPGLPQTQYFKPIADTNIRSGATFGVCLVEFSYGDKQFSYLERTGTIDGPEYCKKLENRFQACRDFSSEPHAKRISGHPKLVEECFNQNVICFFPSSRHERPHWINPRAVEDTPIFGDYVRWKGTLGRSLMVESAAQANFQWIMDVLLDARADVAFQASIASVTDGRPNIRYTPILQSNIEEKAMMESARGGLNLLLRAILQDPTAHFALNYRNTGGSRLYIRTSKGVIPSLDHLSAGQAVLFNTFATILRYADRAHLGQCAAPHNIQGIVLIDEIDAHLHTTLQNNVLPILCSLCHKVQFIITSHSPLFLLGMEKAFGSERTQIIEMPEGRIITTERFAEFQRSFECYQRTKTFEEAVGLGVQEQLNKGSRPLVLTEGKIDAQYVRTALELLGCQDILDRLDIECVGTPGQANVSGSGSGKGSLDAARTFLRDNPRFVNRRVLLLYDHDTDKKPSTEEKLVVRVIPHVAANTRMQKGIENLLPDSLFDDPEVTRPFIREKEKPTGYVVTTTVREFDKQGFCDWMCQVRRNRDDFADFCVVVETLEEFLALATPC